MVGPRYHLQRHSHMWIVDVRYFSWLFICITVFLIRGEECPKYATFMKVIIKFTQAKPVLIQGSRCSVIDSINLHLQGPGAVVPYKCHILRTADCGPYHQGRHNTHAKSITFIAEITMTERLSAMWRRCWTILARTIIR